jgi:hypothetical protein
MKLSVWLFAIALASGCCAKTQGAAEIIQATSKRAYGIDAMSLVGLLSNAQLCTDGSIPGFVSSSRETLKLVKAGYLRKVHRGHLECYERTEKGWAVYRDFKPVASGASKR